MRVLVTRDRIFLILEDLWAAKPQAGEMEAACCDKCPASIVLQGVAGLSSYKKYARILSDLIASGDEEMVEAVVRWVYSKEGESGIVNLMNSESAGDVDTYGIPTPRREIIDMYEKLYGKYLGIDRELKEIIAEAKLEAKAKEERLSILEKRIMESAQRLMDSIQSSELTGTSEEESLAIRKEAISKEDKPLSLLSRLQGKKARLPRR